MSDISSVRETGSGRVLLTEWSVQQASLEDVDDGGVCWSLSLTSEFGIDGVSAFSVVLSPSEDYHLIVSLEFIVFLICFILLFL